MGDSVHDGGLCAVGQCDDVGVGVGVGAGVDVDDRHGAVRIVDGLHDSSGEYGRRLT